MPVLGKLRTSSVGADPVPAVIAGDAPGGFSEELKEFQISIGIEYGYNELFFARAGYFYEAKIKGNRRFFSVGAGKKYNRLGFNFSTLYQPGRALTAPVEQYHPFQSHI